MPEIQRENADTNHLEREMLMPNVRHKDNPGIAKIASEAVMKRPWALVLVRLLKKERTSVAILLAAWCLAEGVYFGKPQFTIAGLNAWVVIGLLLIGAGLAFRLAALGCIRKKEHLATRGVYSLCRHPLYLGSFLLSYGFCTLLADVENFVLATIYFVVFYPLTILWEEERLAVRYGETHHQYRTQTPMLLPLGTFQAGEFTWRAAMSNGGALLLSAVIILLAGIEILAGLLIK